MPDDSPRKLTGERSAPKATPGPGPGGTRNKIRFVTAASLFDGHDASINIIRRILQSAGAEVIHLGHNRAVEEVVTAAVQEDVQGIAVSSYQGGHLEYFKYMIGLLRERGAERVRIFGGGGGVISPEEIQELRDGGVARIYTPEDGHRLGLRGMIDDMLAEADFDLTDDLPASLDGLEAPGGRVLARMLTALERDALEPELKAGLDRMAAAAGPVPVLGVTGTGGAGKSSLTDEVIRRFRLDHPDLRIAVIAIDPSKRKSGGALLGDRIRMNAIDGTRVFMRSLATRDSASEVPAYVPDMIAACKAAGYGLVIVETPGIGQGDAGIVAHVDCALYVMTPEFGAPSQLEKIDMLDFADLVAINKFDRRGAEDALRDVRKQVQRGQERFGDALEDMPVYGTVAAQFNDGGVTALYHGLLDAFTAKGLGTWSSDLPRSGSKISASQGAMVPGERVRYLAEIAETLQGYHGFVAAQVAIARARQSLREARDMVAQAGKDTGDLAVLIAEREAALDPRCGQLLDDWPEITARYRSGDRDALTVTTLSGTVVPKVALPRYESDGELLRWLLEENLPGSFPYAAGIFPFKRESEDPTRMFAGEGDAFRTNERFKVLSRDSEAKRLSTAFDSVTLYGFDPDERPDIYGKVGTSGVSIATLDDMKVLYGGFDLCAPATSVSMTINGPAPAILAMFFNTAIDQQLASFEAEQGRAPNPDEAARISTRTLEAVRGTVQADILKEDQGQNTCIFSTEFALRMMADIQEYFVEHRVRNFYSVSISGYHIAEAGANPISQLAFTLANGFTYVEAYLARGMKIDDFAPNLSFFFSNGMDPEYSVIGRVARRIWAVAMRDKYGANARSQKLKYHIQTSGRSLHAQEMDFNDIRTTLQALIAVYDNCNSLHTNSHDEAFTTPTAESLRRAMAIQMIINQEWGLSKNENPGQGAFIIEELTELVEAAVLEEFERLSERGGVLGAMETGYQRGKIQDESLIYETLKHDGRLPIVGVNTFRNPDGAGEAGPVELRRSSEAEKQGQIARLRDFQARHADRAPVLLKQLQITAASGGNVFAALMDAVRGCSLGQITDALFEVGGQYRRNM